MFTDLAIRERRWCWPAESAKWLQTIQHRTLKSCPGWVGGITALQFSYSIIVCGRGQHRGKTDHSNGNQANVSSVRLLFHFKRFSFGWKTPRTCSVIPTTGKDKNNAPNIGETQHIPACILWEFSMIPHLIFVSSAQIKPTTSYWLRFNEKNTKWQTDLASTMS